MSLVPNALHWHFVAIDNSIIPFLCNVNGLPLFFSPLLYNSKNIHTLAWGKTRNVPRLAWECWLQGTLLCPWCAQTTLQDRHLHVRAVLWSGIINMLSTLCGNPVSLVTISFSLYSSQTSFEISGTHGLPMVIEKVEAVRWGFSHLASSESRSWLLPLFPGGSVPLTTVKFIKQRGH